MIFLIFLLSCSDMFDSREFSRKRSAILKVAKTKSFKVKDIDHDNLEVNWKQSIGDIPKQDLSEVWSAICKFNKDLFNNLNIELVEEKKASYLKVIFEKVTFVDDNVKGKIETSNKITLRDALFNSYKRYFINKDKYDTKDKREKAEADLKKKVENSYLNPMGDGEVYLYLKKGILKSNIESYIPFDKHFYDKVYSNASEQDLEKIKETLNSYCYRFVYELEKRDEELEIKVGIEVKKKGTKNRSLVNLFRGVL